jgi:hypothetical protein
MATLPGLFSGFPASFKSKVHFAESFFAAMTALT